MLKANPEDPKFIEAIKDLKEGDTIELEDGILVVEHKFTTPTHFTFHQRIFPAGMILRRPEGTLRIFVEAEKLGMKVDLVDLGQFNDTQIKEDGTVLPADPQTQAK